MKHHPHFCAVSGVSVLGEEDNPPWGKDLGVSLGDKGEVSPSPSPETTGSQQLHAGGLNPSHHGHLCTGLIIPAILPLTASL